MTDIQPRSAALGAIFEYPNPVNRNAVVDWFSDQGFSTTDMSRRQLTLGGSDVQIGEAVQAPPKVAERDGVEILYNADATLDGFGNGSFVTVRDNRRGDLQRVLGVMEDISDMFERFEMDRQLQLYELTIDAVIRVSEGRDITNYYSSEKLDEIGDVTGSVPQALATKFESTTDATEPGWYQLLIDSGATKNPYLWRVHLQQRFESKEDVDMDNINTILRDTVNIASEG